MDVNREAALPSVNKQVSYNIVSDETAIMIRSSESIFLKNNIGFFGLMYKGT